MKMLTTIGQGPSNMNPITVFSRRAARSSLLTTAGVALAALALGWSPGAAHACTCPKPLTAAEALTGAVVVFEGVARGKAVPTPGVLDPATHVPAVKQTFAVTRRWKGEVPAMVDVLTAERDSSCGQSYATDTRYLVYVNRDDGGHLWDDSCSRTRVVAMADEDLAALGAGMPPAPGAAGGSATDAGASDAGESGGESSGCSLISRGRTRVAPGFLATFVLGLAAVARRRRPGR